MHKQVIRGFFDSNESSFKLWTKASSKTLRDQKVILSSQFFKRSKDSKALCTRTFILTPKYLFYKKSLVSRTVRGLMDLEGVRVEFLSPAERDLADEGAETRHMYSLKFLRNNKYAEIFTKDPQVLEEWRKALGKLAIMTDFHERYEVVSQLGKGSFARVRMPYFLFNFLIESETDSGQPRITKLNFLPDHF